MCLVRNLLLFTYYFPPDDGIGSQRFGKMCRHMEDFGWRPHVVCPHSEGHSAHGLPEDRVIRIGRQDPAANKGGARKSVREANPLARLLYRVGKRLRVDLRAIDASVVTWAREVRSHWPEIRDRLPPVDCVLSTYGPTAPHWLARRYAKELTVPWVADYRDPCSLFPLGRSVLIRTLDRWLERYLLRGADSFVLVTDTWREMMTSVFGLEGTTVFNGWDPSEVPDHDGETEDYLYYGGRLYPNQLSSVSVLLTALAKRVDQRLVFLSMGPADLEAWLRTECDRMGIADRVSIRPPVAPEVAASLAARARATVAFQGMTSAQWSRGWLPGKLMQQIGLAPPVLCIAHPDSEIGAVLARTGKGRLCSTPEEVVAFLSSPASEAGDADGIDFFSRRNQAARLCAHLDNRLQIWEDRRS